MGLFPKTKLEKANDKIDELTETIKKRDSKLDERTGELSDETKRREKAEEDLKTANHTISTLENKNIANESIIKNLNSEKNSLNKTVKEQKDEIDNLNKTITEITEESTRVFAERDNYKQLYEKFLAKNHANASSKGGVVKELNKTKKELEQATDIINKQNDEITHLKNKPAVPNIQDLKTYDENPKLAARKRKGKLIHVNN